MPDNPTTKPAAKAAVTPGLPGSARVEYSACREDVEAMLAKGYSVRMVYERMQELGRVSCGYSAFCDYVRGGGKRLHSRKKAHRGNQATSQMNRANVAIPTQPTPRVGPSKTGSQFGGSFPDMRSMDVKDAI